MPQDPAMIQREIEETRAELAQTIDAIVDIVSPRRVAERAKVQFEAKVSEFRQKVLPAPDLTPSLEPGSAAGAGDMLPAVPAGAIGGTAGATGGVVVRRTVRWDRVAIASGTLLFLIVAGGRRRRRRHAD